MVHATEYDQNFVLTCAIPAIDLIFFVDFESFWLFFRFFKILSAPRIRE